MNCGAIFGLGATIPAVLQFDSPVIIRHSFLPPDNTRLAHLCGSLDENLRSIESALDISISRRNEYFLVDGGKAQAERGLALLQALYGRAQESVSVEQVQLALVELTSNGERVAPTRRRRGATPPDSAATDAGQVDKGASAAAAAASSVILRTRRPDLVGRTPNQLNYLRNILHHDITFGIGPAGTGKTFLAVACAVDALERSAVQRIILTRPAVEAGERLGFLPGDLAQKVDPYLRPLYDALYDLMGADKVSKAFEKGTLEVAPLAFMRGRTLSHAFVILDEAQNSTAEQMKMFLTRIGFGSKAVVTGDVSQIDLPRGTESGLIDAERELRRVRGIAITQFTSADVVRHPWVARIVDAYAVARRCVPLCHDSR